MISAELRFYFFCFFYIKTCLLLAQHITIFSPTVDFPLLGNSWRRWPRGKYSIPMSIYGCPDQELNNWSHGSYNITISTDQTYDLEGVNGIGDVFRWKKSDLLLLGPFGEYTFSTFRNCCILHGHVFVMNGCAICSLALAVQEVLVQNMFVRIMIQTNVFCHNDHFLNVSPNV